MLILGDLNQFQIKLELYNLFSSETNKIQQVFKYFDKNNDG